MTCSPRPVSPGTLLLLSSSAFVALVVACLSMFSSPVRADGDDAPLTNIIALSSQRLALAEPVARWKWAHHESITDEPREAALLASVDKKARAIGIDPAFAQLFFRDQIDASKDVQNALFEEWRKSRPPEGTPRDLARDTRPKLDSVTQALVAALARVEPIRNADDCPTRLAESVARWKHLTRYDAAQNAPLSHALAHVCASGGVGAVG
jgi:chorismate mutase